MRQTNASGPEAPATRGGALHAMFRAVARSSVKARINAGFTVLVLVLVVAVAASVASTIQHRSQLAAIREHTEAAATLQQASHYSFLTAIQIQRYVATGDESLVPDIKQSMASTATSFERVGAQMAERHGSDTPGSAFSAVTDSAQGLQLMPERIIGLVQDGQATEAALLLDHLEPHFNDFRSTMEQLVEDERAEQLRHHHQADRAAGRAMATIAIAGTTIVLLALLVTILITRSILVPLSRLRAAAEAVSGGRLDERAPTGGPLELAAVADAFNSMTEALLDASQRRELEDALRESEERYRILIETANDIVYTASADGTITSLNPAFEKVSGWKREDWIGKNFAPLIHPDDLLQALTEWQRAAEGKAEGSFILRVMKADGSHIPTEFSSTSHMHDGAFMGITGIARDITERVRAQEALRSALDQIAHLNRKLEKRVEHQSKKLKSASREIEIRSTQAATDELTGLGNRRAFRKRLESETALSRESDDPLSLIIVDLDHFKNVNDTLGHQAGDEILRRLADVLRDASGHRDAFRYGGDEFAIILPATTAHEAERIADRLRENAEASIGSAAGMVTVSAGVASYPNPCATADELFYAADAAMYWAKSAGKNRVGVYNAEMSNLIGTHVPATGIPAPANGHNPNN